MKGRNVLAAGAALALCLAARIAAADEAPNFDVSVTCREAAKLGGGVDASLAYKGCMQDEKAAAATLRGNWSRYAKQNRDTCLAAGLKPIPSYVEILTCIEMYDDVGALTRNRGQVNASPAAPAGGVAPISPGAPAN